MADWKTNEPNLSEVTVSSSLIEECEWVGKSSNEIEFISPRNENIFYVSQILEPEIYT